ncbi:MAG: hypothetical protein HOP08_18305 [Cyclobacteriaceae bacterium]|nr:hypothetical protein [Cyclobacteriaceae bacterium]
MDDQNFDKFIKDKLEGYQDPSFDESAMAGFHEKLSAVQPLPFYQQTWTHYLAAASIAVLTVILFWYSSFEKGTNNVSETNKAQLKIDSLLIVIHDLKEQVSSTSSLSSSLSNDNVSNTVNQKGEEGSVIVNERTSKGSSRKMIALGRTSDLPAEISSVLMRKGMLVDDNGSAYLVAPDKEGLMYVSLDHDQKSISSVYPSPRFNGSFVSVSRKENEVARVTSIKKNEISSEKREDLEKHYTNGIGINLGPHADLMSQSFSKGHGLIVPRFGLLAEVVVSPKLSFEAGVDYFYTAMDFDRNFQFQTIEIPNLDYSLGTINQAHIENTILSTPISIKYRKWVSEKNQAFVRIGYTPYFSIIQEYQCGYEFNNMSGNSYPPPYYSTNHQVTSILQVKDNFFYGNTTSVSLGLTHQIRNKDKIEGSLFYESSLAPVGHERLSMSLFGIRTAYWFRLR